MPARLIAWRTSSELQDSATRHAPGDGPACVHILEDVNQERRADETDVEQDGRSRIGGKSPGRIEHAAEEGHQRDQKNVGKGDAGEIDGKVEFAGLVDEPGRQDRDDPRHRHLEDGDQHGENQGENCQDLAGQPPSDRLAISLEAAGEERYEHCVESALRQKAPEEIGELEGNEKGVGHPPRSQGCGKEHVAHKAKNSARGRQSADRQESPGEIHPPLTASPESP